MSFQVLFPVFWVELWGWYTSKVAKSKGLKSINAKWHWQGKYFYIFSFCLACSWCLTGSCSVTLYTVIKYYNIQVLCAALYCGCCMETHLHVCVCLWKWRNCFIIVLLVHISHKFQMLLKYIPWSLPYLAWVLWYLWWSKDIYKEHYSRQNVTSETLIRENFMHAGCLWSQTWVLCSWRISILFYRNIFSFGKG